MSRVRKTESEHHHFRMTEQGRELILVGGSRPYLWTGPEDGAPGAVYTFSGDAALLALADAIRALIPEK